MPHPTQEVTSSMQKNTLPLIGLRKDGRPIYLMQGGSGENDTPPASGAGDSTPTGQSEKDPDGEKKAREALIAQVTEEVTAKVTESFKAELSKKNNEAKNLRDKKNDLERRLAAVEKGEEDPGPASDKREVDPTVQALLDRLAALEAKDTTSALEAAKKAAASKHNLPEWAVERLHGETAEALEADAARFAEALKPAAPRGVRDLAFGRGADTFAKASAADGQTEYERRHAAKK